MTKTLHLFIFLFFSAIALPLSAGSDDEEREGGILGTGIVGTITRLGSIYVNGQHIRFDPGMMLTDGLGASVASELRPGHTVAVIANRDGDDWRASYIRQVLPLVGPLHRSDDGRLDVMGTHIVTEGVSFTAKSGDWVAVSGLWQDNRIIATRIDPVSAESGARIEGSALDFDAKTGLRLGDTDILGLVPQHIREGDVIRAFGTPGASTLTVEQLETGVFDSEPGVILAEGYMSPPRPSGLYTVLGANVVSFTDNPGMIDPTVLFFACGKDGTISASLKASDGSNAGKPFFADCLNPVPKAP